MILLLLSFVLDFCLLDTWEYNFGIVFVYPSPTLDILEVQTLPKSCDSLASIAKTMPKEKLDNLFICLSLRIFSLNKYDIGQRSYLVYE
eukprot:snap_masked-scaffold_77-processed-gene-0.26-mRNA-1 protein AED:1.00 eAED:1.00 QI:0/0/0/0/1/1/2/0/88